MNLKLDTLDELHSVRSDPPLVRLCHISEVLQQNQNSCDPSIMIIKSPSTDQERWNETFMFETSGRSRRSDEEMLVRSWSLLRWTGLSPLIRLLSSPQGGRLSSDTPAQIEDFLQTEWSDPREPWTGSVVIHWGSKAGLTFDPREPSEDVSCLFLLTTSTQLHLVTVSHTTL